MTIAHDKTVREIAVELPQSTRIFEGLKIDYCCGGQRVLSEACALAGVDVKRAVALLEQATLPESVAKIDFQEASLTELLTHILDTHHVYVRREMARLEDLAPRVTTAHGATHPELLSVDDLARQLFSDLNPHMLKEEQILFPFIIELEKARLRKGPVPRPPFGNVNNPIRMMMLEHDAAGEILRELRKVTVDYKPPHDACLSYQTFYRALEEFEQDLHQHIHLENNILFPKAIALEAGAG